MTAVRALTLIAMLVAAESLADAQAPAGTQALTAEEAEANYRDTFRLRQPAEDCPNDENEIVVCGRREGPTPRLPLPVDPIPGERIRLVAGEQARPIAETCLRLCLQPVGITLTLSGGKARVGH